MGNYYLAERLKNRHTFVGKLIVVMPLITVCLAAWLMKDYFTIDSYNWWYIVLFPGLLALVCAMVGGRDKKMENRAIRALPVDMGAVWDGKVLYGIRCLGISLLVFLGITLAISTGLEQTAGAVFRINPSAGEQLAAVGILFVTSLWQIPFCLFLQEMIGVFPMVLIHMGSYFLSAVELSLHTYFMLLPGGITARLMCMVLKILPNGLVAEPGSLTFTPQLLEKKGLPVGIAASVMWFLAFWIVSRTWFDRQTKK